MRPLYFLFPRDKAKLLHQLFPEEIPNLIQFIASTTKAIEKQYKETVTPAGINGHEEWNHILRDVQHIISKHSNKMAHNPASFATLLFKGKRALCSCYCMEKYLSGQQNPDKKFMLAIDLLFRPL